MLTINPTTYSELATLLVAEINEKEYYSGTVNLFTPDVDYHLSTTLMLRYRDVECPDISYSEIAAVIPIWWEMSTIVEDGEILNDFDFNILARNICQ